ncbi:MAG: M48 family metallopeptidase [Proteobacteria bacterium]|nr:M48 family metallopeptidase [Pseudomonadota bacterium]
MRSERLWKEFEPYEGSPEFNCELTQNLEIFSGQLLRIFNKIVLVSIFLVFIFFMKNILHFNGLNIEIERKPIKNIYFRVYPPEGNIKVTAPMALSLNSIKKLIEHRFDWLQSRAILYKKPQFKPEPNSIYYLGHSYFLQLKQGKSFPYIENDQFYLYLKDPESTIEQNALIEQFYRRELIKIVPPLIKKWEPILNVKVKEWRIKKMKTRWGTCNIKKHRIWMNLNLMEKNLACIEYVLVHEMVHLLEASHNKRFHQLMTQFLPEWKILDKQLKGKN